MYLRLCAFRAQCVRAVISRWCEWRYRATRDNLGSPRLLRAHKPSAVSGAYFSHRPGVAAQFGSPRRFGNGIGVQGDTFYLKVGERSPWS
jgi:hypothetical protein